MESNGTSRGIVNYTSRDYDSEKWRDLIHNGINYGKWYAISSKGRVYRKEYYVDKSDGTRQVIHSRMLTLSDSTGGYLSVHLEKVHQVETYHSPSYMVHVLVAHTFIPNSDKKPCVNHKDGNKHNNCVENLEWCTFSENSRHAVESGLMKHIRPVRVTTPNGDVKEFKSAAHAQRFYNLREGLNLAAHTGGSCQGYTATFVDGQNEILPDIDRRRHYNICCKETGEIFQSAKYAGARFNVSAECIRHGLKFRSGYVTSIDRNFEYIPCPDRWKIVENGKTFPSLSDLARYLNFSFEGLKRYVNDGFVKPKNVHIIQIAELPGGVN